MTQVMRPYYPVPGKDGNPGSPIRKNVDKHHKNVITGTTRRMMSKFRRTAGPLSNVKNLKRMRDSQFPILDWG